MEETNEIEQINLYIIGVIVIILVLLHAIYLLTVRKKKVLNEETISDEEYILQGLTNRIIAGIVVFMFFCFAYNNFSNLEEKTTNSYLQLSVSVLALIAVSIEIYLAYSAYISIQEEIL